MDTNWGGYLNPGSLSAGNSVDTFCDMQTCELIATGGISHGCGPANPSTLAARHHGSSMAAATAAATAAAWQQQPQCSVEAP